MGGTIDHELFDFRAEVFEWNLTSNIIKQRASKPHRSLDFGSCYYKGYVYICEGGPELFSDVTFSQTSRYNVQGDYWQVQYSLIGR
eukprot:403365021